MDLVQKGMKKSILTLSIFPFYFLCAINQVYIGGLKGLGNHDRTVSFQVPEGVQ